MCMETYPCKHFNSMNLESPEIWRRIRSQPNLKHEQPELWNHFSTYDKFRWDDVKRTKK